MRYRGGDRAVSVVIGAVLLLGIAVTLLALLQMSAVPVWNKEVEFDHNQAVQDDIKNLRGSVLETAATGASRTTSIDLGTGYPNRVILRNPPPSTGTISTNFRDNITIPNSRLLLDNVSVDGPAGNYWNGSVKELMTRAVHYSPKYDQYDSAPATVLENTVVYNVRENASNVSVGLTEQNLVSGKRINLVTINGSLSETQSGSVNVETVPVSAPATTVSVSDDGSGPINITVPTAMPNSTWSRLLEDEYVSNGGFIQDQSFTRGENRSFLHLKFQEGVTYNLRMAKVGLGSSIEEEDAHYITAVEGNRTSVQEGGSRKLVAEVRDRYNNGVTGVLVNASLRSGPGSVTQNNSTTDDSGRVSFTYESEEVSGSVTAEIVMNISMTPETWENVTFEVEVQDTDPGGGGGTVFLQDGFEDGSLSPNWTRQGGPPTRAGVNSDTSSTGSFSAFVCCDTIRVQSVQMDLSGVSGAEVEYWVRRGSDSFSNYPEDGENMVWEYRSSNGDWRALEEFKGGEQPGTQFHRVSKLPSNALHNNFRLRFRHTGGSGSGFDYWHVDDVIVRSS